MCHWLINIFLIFLQSLTYTIIYFHNLFIISLQLMNVKSVTSTRSVQMDIVDVNMDIMVTATNAKKASIAFFFLFL